ncbi:MAG: IS1595 family transposase [Lamprobacter sp.]|uniref:IS1595 family transposase n=1 Tax=Lamprobacter sp. TaxID=3100796 RepID=UPI002B25DEB9|nr:IS1595 family transposase [Lamprobacter sp.]MEA3642208.1 IS1595 family transposase [Lamprobacter sp.]
MRTWVLCLYFMGLNLSNRQIASELGLNKDDVQRMTQQLRQGIKSAQPAPRLSGEVEADEVYVTAGHQGHPDAVQKKRRGRRRRLKGARGRGTLAKEKPPILGLIQRSGEVVLRMLENVQQQTIEPIIRGCVSAGTRFSTDEYDIDSRLTDWGDDHHHSVCHSRSEYARDDDGDGFCEIHVNTMEGVWSLLRSWLRPHRGLSQEHLPLHLNFFQFVHNARVRGKGQLPALLGALVA